jgi:hypothetical protein
VIVQVTSRSRPQAKHAPPNRRKPIYSSVVITASGAAAAHYISTKAGNRIIHAKKRKTPEKSPTEVHRDANHAASRRSQQRDFFSVWVACFIVHRT